MIRERTLDLQIYGVDPVRGFLPPTDPLTSLPGEFDSWELLAADVPALLLTGDLRSRVKSLPDLCLDDLEDERALERAMLIISLIGSAYVWAGPEPVSTLPIAIAQPWWALSEQLGRPPIISHASLVLNNWRKLDPNGPITLENLDTLCTFLDGSDERWFYLVTVAIEAAGGPAVSALVAAQAAVLSNDVSGVLKDLRTIESCLEEMWAILKRMPEHCDPYIFYHRVRPYLSSWPEGGLVYEGVDAQPHRFSGGSAAQSSLIQALDAGLGIQHASPFLADMRNYMPSQHRRFIEAVEDGPSIHDFVVSRSNDEPELAEQLNTCITLLDVFRQTHLELSVRYIKQQTPADQVAIGTGGTDFVPMLTEARKETRAGRI